MIRSKILWLLLILVLPEKTFAQDKLQEKPEQTQKTFNIMPPNLPKIQIDTKTMGGRQFWGDLKFFHGYRIQRNVLSQHHRLLDPDDVRKAWGTYEECEQALADIAVKHQLPPMQGRAVIFIHGIIRSSKSFHKMAQALKQQGYTTVGFDYPSTRMTMQQSNEFLKKTIDSLEGIEEIDIVCHSMGGLLVRTYYKEMGELADPRIKRLVMMGTPNKGAKMANLLKNNLAFQWVMGPAGQQLVKDELGTIASLPVPGCGFAIVAGARGTENGWNPLVPGDDDGTVSLESAQLSGAKDFITVSSLHSFLPEDRTAIAAVARYLMTGAFRESGKCHPID